MNKKCFISQPMRNIPDEEVIANRNRAIAVLKEMGYDYVSSWAKNTDFHPENDPEVKHIRAAYLARALGMLAKCDAIYFCKGWEEKAGCRIEEFIAKEYGIPRFYEEASF